MSLPVFRTRAGSPGPGSDLGSMAGRMQGPNLSQQRAILIHFLTATRVAAKFGTIPGRPETP